MAFIRFLFKNLDQFKPAYLLTFLAGMGNGTLSFLIPLLLAEFTKSSFNLIAFQRLLFYILLCYMGSLFLQWLIRRHGEAIAQQMGNHIREKYFAKFQALSLHDLQRHHSGYRLALLNKVADSMNLLLFHIVWTISSSIPVIILFFSFTAKESIPLAFLNIVILTFFVVVSFFFSKRIAVLADELNKNKASMLKRLIDFMTNLVTIRKLGIKSFATATLHKDISKNQEKIQELQNYHARRWFTLHAIYGIAFLSTITFFLYKIAGGKISSAILILFIAAYGMVRWQIENLSEYVKQLMEISYYITALDGITSTKKQKATFIPSSWRELRAQDASFTYAPQKKPLTIPSFTLREGEKICIRGKSGEGKTTLLQLIAKLRQPQHGSFFVDSVPYADIAEDFFATHTVFVSQETELFDASLEENLTLGKKIRKEDLMRMLKDLDLHHLLEKTHDTRSLHVGEKGINLSSGEKQRINLLRAVILDRDIYLLDEPTAHLDAQTEQKVVAFVKNHLRSKTIILVSHNKSIQSFCSRIYEIKDKKLYQS